MTDVTDIVSPLIDIIAPTLWRHERLAGLVANIHDATVSSHRITFVLETADTESINEIARLSRGDGSVRGILNDRIPTSTGAFNAGVLASTSPYWLLGADDLRFHRAWDLAALKRMTGDVRVVGCHDLRRRDSYKGTGASHFLVDRRYLADQGGSPDLPPGIAFCEDYTHFGIDIEFVGVAQRRNVYAHALDAVVEHCHWTTGKTDRDATSDHAEDSRQADLELERSRQHMWRK